MNKLNDHLEHKKCRESHMKKIDWELEKINEEQYLESLIKTGFASIPFVGNIFNEVLFELPNRINQERINKLVTELKKELEEIKNKNTSIMRTEEYIDLTYLILKKAATNKYEEKFKIFANILASPLSPGNKDLEDIFLHNYVEIISNLNPLEMTLINDIYVQLNSKFDTISDFKLTINVDYSSNIVLGIPNEKSKMTIDSLISKGLLLDDPDGMIGYTPRNNIGLTDLGVSLMIFIESKL